MIKVKDILIGDVVDKLNKTDYQGDIKMKKRFKRNGRYKQVKISITGTKLGEQICQEGPGLTPREHCTM